MKFFTNILFTVKTYWKSLFLDKSMCLVAGEYRREGEALGILISDYNMKKNNKGIMVIFMKNKKICMIRNILLLPRRYIIAMFEHEYQHFESYEFLKEYKVSRLEEEIYVDHKAAEVVGYPTYIHALTLIHLFPGINRNVLNIRLRSLKDARRRLKATQKDKLAA